MIDPEEFLRLHPVKVETEPSQPEALSEESGKLYDRCMSSALRSLDAAGTSVEGLRKRLLSKDFDSDTVERVIATLVRMKLLDDDAFAASFLNRCLGKMMGPMAVRREMAKRGVDPEVSSRLIDEAVSDGRFDESARQLVDSIDSKTRGMDYQKRLRRLAGAAQRKGHSMSLIRGVGSDFFKR
ncbi:MAG: RecX family transcriptional regulator [Bifidobacteriaceae bacterium]|jgi:regulatory protein|nr:RecX family transcriptional regulator [Bifidobacteriaceae bacterium]MCI1915077.1 RecX family transcriptional regulator [Bifidobacteriaceae bacterium]